MILEVPHEEADTIAMMIVVADMGVVTMTNPDPLATIHTMIVQDVTTMAAVASIDTLLVTIVIDMAAAKNDVVVATTEMMIVVVIVELNVGANVPTDLAHATTGSTVEVEVVVAPAAVAVAVVAAATIVKIAMLLGKLLTRC